MEVISQLLIVLGCLNVLSKNKPQQSQAHLQVAKPTHCQNPQKSLPCQTYEQTGNM